MSAGTFIISIVIFEPCTWKYFVLTWSVAGCLLRQYFVSGVCKRKVSVVSDDTDVFVLLLHHYQLAGLDVSLVWNLQARIGQ